MGDNYDRSINVPQKNIEHHPLNNNDDRKKSERINEFIYCQMMKIDI